jgi:hypothetical protein
MRSPRRLGIFAVSALGGLLAVGTAAADTGAGPDPTTHTVVVHDDTEAWYQVLPVGICSTPIGCPPPLPLPVPGPSTIYPEGTLHVGAALGVEISRTYLRPALYSLPTDATVTAATATVPIDPDLKAGTINLDGAHIVACLVTAPVINGIQGALEDPPPINCRFSSKAVLAKKRDAFTIDLAPFLAAWRGGKPNYGFALTPSDKLGTLGIWQVALNGQAVAGAPHVSYRLTYTQPGTDIGTTVTVPPTAPPSPPEVVIPPPPPPVVVVSQYPVAPPGVAQPQQPVALARSTGYKYSAVFLVPLVFLFALVFLGRTFTRDATPLNAGAGAAKRRH